MPNDYILLKWTINLIFVDVNVVIIVIVNGNCNSNYMIR